MSLSYNNERIRNKDVMSNHRCTDRSMDPSSLEHLTPSKNDRFTTHGGQMVLAGGFQWSCWIVAQKNSWKPIPTTAPPKCCYELNKQGEHFRQCHEPIQDKIRPLDHPQTAYSDYSSGKLGGELTQAMIHPAIRNVRNWIHTPHELQSASRNDS